MIEPITVEHVTLVSDRSFHDVVRAFEQQVGTLEGSGWPAIPAASRDQDDFGVELWAKAAAEHVARPRGAQPSDVHAAGRDSLCDYVRTRGVVGVEAAGACCQDEQNDCEADCENALCHRFSGPEVPAGQMCYAGR